jgi:hypothetical protein
MKLGLYKIQEVLGPLIYRLELSSSMRIHLVFYISLLELASKNAKPAHIQLSDETQDDVYKVKKVLNEQ